MSAKLGLQNEALEISKRGGVPQFKERQSGKTSREDLKNG
jgi:hypothetical protein